MPRLRNRRWLIHSSGRFDRADASWAAAFRTLHRKGSIITGTEAAGRDGWLFAAALEDYGWSWAHLSEHVNGPAAAENYAAWDERVWTRGQRPFAYKLSDKTYVRVPEYGGGRTPKFHALVVHLQKRRRVGQRREEIALVVVHMPTTATEQRQEVWADCCLGLVALKAKLRQDLPYAEVIIVGDYNKNLRENHEAAQIRFHLERPLGKVHSWSNGLPDNGGTHGRQVIDYALIRRSRLGGCELLPVGDDSDHRAFRYRVRRA